MGSGPIPASRAALDKAGWSVSDLDLIEANEAFAAQACAVNIDMGWDTSKVNVYGGAASYTYLRAHETKEKLVCPLLLE